MKRVLITSMAILGFIVTSSAQNKGKIEIGINAGLNSSNASTGYDSADPSIGFNFGASADYYFSNSISRASKVMSECRNIKSKQLKSGTNN